MNTRLGAIFLYIPKLRKGVYLPFFLTERKRFELAPAALGTAGLFWLTMSLAVRFYKKRAF
jgi:hypothetical protein